MKMRLVLCAATILVASSAEARTMKCAKVTKADIESQFTAFNDAWQTGDPDKVTALFSKNAVLLATVAAKPRTTHAGIRDYFVGFLKNSPVGHIQTSTITLGCNKATRVGTWDVTLTNPKTHKKSVAKARYSFIYRYEDGHWMISHLHSSLLPA